MIQKMDPAVMTSRPNGGTDLSDGNQAERDGDGSTGEDATARLSSQRKSPTAKVLPLTMLTQRRTSTPVRTRGPVTTGHRRSSQD